MTKYVFDGKTRVGLIPALYNIDAPTLVELAAGTDISCDLTSGGLRLAKTTEFLDASPWKGDALSTRIGHYGFAGPSLEGYRFTPPDTELLWDLAVFRAEMFMVVRRGVDTEQPWADGDLVETYEIRFGKRSVYDSGVDTPVTFTVPIAIVDDSDQAVVTAGS